MIEAKIVCDSINDSGNRITTFVVTYPRFIHSEMMTHRMLSRNASSSRAIPVKKQIQMVIDNPAIPLAFTKNKAGMQGGEVLDASAHEAAVEAWLSARDRAVEHAKLLAGLEVHKQYANRILEPFAHITVVVTATEWSNFFALRCHEAAQPEIHALADLMYALYAENKPTNLREGEWHLPFISNEEKLDFIGAKAMTVMEIIEEQNRKLIKCSVARCARVSYLNHEGTEPTVEQDFQLYDRLLGGNPIHASPAEHQAMAIDGNLSSGNFTGWRQYRKTLMNENITEFKKN